MKISAKKRKPSAPLDESDALETSAESLARSKRTLDARRTTTARAVAALVFAVFLGFVATRPFGETRRYPGVKNAPTANVVDANAETARSLANGVARVLTDRAATLAARSAPRIVETSAKETSEAASNGDGKTGVPDSSTPSQIGFVVDLNVATKAELTNLPRIGPTLADRIIEYREERGGFRSVDELINIDNIGEKTLAKLRPYCVVFPPKDGENDERPND